MKCLADIEVESDLCVEEGGDPLVLSHPEGRYLLTIQSEVASEEAEARLMNVQMKFDAPDLGSAKDIALENLSHALGYLALVTGGRFEYRHLRKVIDWTPNKFEREALVYAVFDPDADSQHEVTQTYFDSVQKILQAKPNPKVEQALRWFRLGIGSESLEESFQFFWFALEIVASFKKPHGKVSDKCAVCGGKLYCESCCSYPEHKPYPKQAIRALLEAITKEKAEEFFGAFDLARNCLMHGGRISDIEEELPCDDESLVNTLGNVTWHALLLALPAGTIDGKLEFMVPSTYLRRKLVTAAHISCNLPLDETGEPKLVGFPELEISLVESTSE